MGVRVREAVPNMLPSYKKMKIVPKPNDHIYIKKIGCNVKTNSTKNNAKQNKTTRSKTKTKTNETK